MKSAASIYTEIKNEFVKDTEACFVAAVIWRQQDNTRKKLFGLQKLLRNGNEVRTDSFELDVLLIDGERKSWNDLIYFEQYLAA